MAKSSENQKSNLVPVLKFLALIALIVLLYYFARDWNVTLQSLKDKVGAYPTLLGFVVFTMLYAFVSVAPIAGRDVFKLLAALLWGWWLSTLFVFVGEMVAALVSFFLSRALGKEFIDRLFGKRLESTYKKINRAGFRNVIILRVLPITPYRFFNFAAGVTDIRFSPYILGSAIGIIIRTAFFQGLFTLLGEQLLEHGVSIGQILIFSIIFSTAMLIIWVVYNRFFAKRNSQAS